jgi:glutathione synthase/RimK-type ligase-like ATP-grasp enzyme
MSSDRKITAGRNNAKKSTGPRSVAGREAARRNARRHGLAVAIGGDPAFHEDIEKLAKVLSLSSGTQQVSEHAREAAEAELDLLRIRKVRAFLFDRLYFADAAAPDGITDLNRELAKLERYERRAFSRRKRSLRAM